MWQIAIPAAVEGVKAALANDKEEDARHDARMQQEQNNALQREFAQNGISWKVADAQRAGVHPLFALGGNTASYSPNPIVTDFGQNVSRAAQAGASPEEREISAAQLRLLEAQAQKEFAMSSYYASEAARTSQGLGASAPIPMSDGAPPGQIVHKPSESISARAADPSLQASPANPAWQEENLGGDNRLDVLRTDDLGETLSQTSLFDLGGLLTIARNLKKHGALLPFELARGERFSPGAKELARIERVVRLLTGGGKQSEKYERQYNQVVNPIEASYAHQLVHNRGKFGRR